MFTKLETKSVITRVGGQTCTHKKRNTITRKTMGEKTQVMLYLFFWFILYERENSCLVQPHALHKCT